MSRTPILTILFTLIFFVAIGTVAANAQQTSTPPPPSSPTATPPLNLNSATTTELQKLPGIGPAVAARIIEYRQKIGGFKKIEDLMNVRGIGEKTFLRLKPLITVAPVKTTER